MLHPYLLHEAGSPEADKRRLLKSCDCITTLNAACHDDKGFKHARHAKDNSNYMHASLHQAALLH